MNSICIFCGANPGLDPDFEQQALNLADELVARNITLVYGGSSIGLMGILADRALEKGGRVVGVIPEQLVKREAAHNGLTEQNIVQTMTERKEVMMNLSDAFIAMPGGYGTLDELFEALTNAQLSLHNKPVGLLNVNGYFDHLLAFLDHAETQSLLAPDNRRLLRAGNTPVELLERLSQS